MFEVNNGVTNINGINGKYDKNVKDSSVKYGRNAVENFYTYMEHPIINDKTTFPPILETPINDSIQANNEKEVEKYIKENGDYLKALPPLEFEYRYMPKVINGNIDKKALLASAYEEMGKRDEISVNDMDNMILPSKEYSSKALDTNKDGKVSVSEYSANILAADMLSKSDNPKFEDIDGTINNKGANAILAYAHISNSDAATKLYKSINDKYKLDK